MLRILLAICLLFSTQAEARRRIAILDAGFLPIAQFNAGAGALPAWMGAFTRASTATFVSRGTGLVTSASTNVARFEANGFLDEPTRDNVALQSTFGASWSVITATLTPAAAVSPDGTSNAASLVFTAAGTAQTLQAITLTAATYTASVWARGSVGGEKFRLKYFNGTVDTFSSDFTLTTSWQRFSFSFTGVAVAGNLSINNGSDGLARTIFVFGYQAEVGAFQTSYIPTAAAPVTRAVDAAAQGAYAANAQIWQRRNISTGVVDRIYYAPGAAPNPLTTGYWYQSGAAYSRALTVAEQAAKTVVNAAY